MNEGNPAVVAAINEQIQMELSAAYLYIAMSAWFDRQDLPGFAHWMKLQSDEEMVHARRLYDHLLDRGATVEFQALPAPPVDFGDVRKAVETVGEHEAKVTRSINAIYELAADKKDHPARIMLQWFIDEQVEEEKSVADLLGRLALVESGKGSLLMVDKELAKRGE